MYPLAAHSIDPPFPIHENMSAKYSNNLLSAKCNLAKINKCVEEEATRHHEGFRPPLRT